jgi:16S rRNA pseudouridine516 synthase
MRLDRLVSHHSGIARRSIVTVIRAGRVKVDGVIERDPSRHISTSVDRVELDDLPVRMPGETTLMFHKPTGCISATESDEHQTVIDVLDATLRRPRLAPIGRLDKDTTGLLILTTDGGLSHLIAHPKRKVSKHYIATLKDGVLDEDAEQRFVAGLELADGTRCATAGLTRLDELRVEVVLTEGRFHQVKRMLGACNGHVIALHRSQIGPLTLDPALEPGEARALTETEIVRLRAASSADERNDERAESDTNDA